MPKIVDRYKKRSEIAAVAIKLFAEKGFEKTSIQEIANNAGIGKGTVYHYFKTKEKIFNQAANEIFNEFGKSIGDTFLQLGDPKEQLSEIIKQMTNTGAEFEQFFIVYMELWLINLRNSGFGDSMKMFEDLLYEFRKMIAHIIDTGKKRNIFRKDVDSMSLGVFLLASLDGILLHYVFDQHRFDIKQIGNDFLEILLNGLLNHIRDP